MVDLSINQILAVTRGDDFNLPLFLNKGSDLAPIRYVLRDFVAISKTTSLKAQSILKKGTYIGAPTVIEGVTYEMQTLSSDITLTANITIGLASRIIKGSTIKSQSTLNDFLIAEDLIVQEDRLYFGVMYPNQQFENSIIKKIFTVNDLNADGDVVIKLSHEDTECLQAGRYYYACKLILLNDFGQSYSVNTVVQKTILELED